MLLRIFFLVSLFPFPALAGECCMYRTNDNSIIIDATVSPPTVNGYRCPITNTITQGAGTQVSTLQCPNTKIIFNRHGGNLTYSMAINGQRYNLNRYEKQPGIGEQPHRDTQIITPIPVQPKPAPPGANESNQGRRLLGKALSTFGKILSGQGQTYQPAPQHIHPVNPPPVRCHTMRHGNVKTTRCY